MSRLTQIQQWLDTVAACTCSELQPASSDASFRRYFRVTDRQQGKTFIVMDAPPDKENCKPFIHVTELLRNAGVNAPAILAMDLKHGFLLLDDLGNRPYLNELNADTADALYTDAIDAMVRMQDIDAILPLYNARLLQAEMDLFEQWYVQRHLNRTLNTDQKAVLLSAFELLVESAEEQPQVFVHRDYHSRNLMITENNNPGVIDYQDAVIGPLSYDLVSLFKDCYIKWPREKVELWLEMYLARITPARLIDKQTLLRWFDLMGVQRHLKVLGIFARLNYRDGKAQYLENLPLTLEYILETCAVYPQLQPLRQLLDSLHG